MKTKIEKKPASSGKKQAPAKKHSTNKNHSMQETQEHSDTSSSYVDLDKANFTERPYDRPSSLGPDHEPKAGI